MKDELKPELEVNTILEMYDNGCVYWVNDEDIHFCKRFQHLKGPVYTFPNCNPILADNFDELRDKIIELLTLGYMYSNEDPESPDTTRKKTVDAIKAVFAASGEQNKEKLLSSMIKACEKGEKEHPEEEELMKNMDRHQKEQFMMKILSRGK